jgi:uncharacterized protein (TIGR04222 family)
MPALSAPGDTWGISGPDFLRIYLGAAVVFLAYAVVARLSVTRSSSAAMPGRLPTPAEVALLLGGRSQAAFSSLARLRVAGVIGVGTKRSLMVTGPVPSTADRLDRAVYSAAQRDVRARDLSDDSQVQSAVAEINDSVAHAGWLLDPSVRTRARLGAHLLLGLTTFGVVRIVAGVMNERDVFFLIALCVITFVIGLSLLRVPRMTRSGRQAVKETQARNLHLSPAQAPSWTTYGMDSAAMAVALYGTAALWVADPAFAAEAEVRRQATSAGYSSGSSGGDAGGGGGGGCGGGGCGGGGCGG